MDEVVRLDRDPAAYTVGPGCNGLPSRHHRFSLNPPPHAPLHDNSLSEAFTWHPMVLGARVVEGEEARVVELQSDGPVSGSGIGIGIGGEDGSGGDNATGGGETGTWEHAGATYQFERAAMEQAGVVRALRELLFGGRRVGTVPARDATTTANSTTLPPPPSPALPMPQPALPDPSLSWRPLSTSLLEPWMGGGESSATPHPHLNPPLGSLPPPPPPPPWPPACGEAIADAAGRPVETVGVPSWILTDVFGARHEGR